jgi:hypothetical protein
MATALTYPTISGVTGAPYISALTDTANIQDTINYLYYGSTKAVSATDGLYGMLTKLQSQISAVSSGINVHENAKFATTTTLAATYAAGTTDASGGTGVGATITFTSTGTQNIDSATITLALNDRVLVKNGTTALSGTSSIANGIYYVSTAPAVGVAGILTRAEDSNNSIAGEMAEGDFLYVSDGDTNANKAWILTTSGSTGTGPAGSIRIGTDAVTYTQFIGVGSYYVGTTSVAIAPANQGLTGISSITLPGSSGTTVLQPSSTASGTLTLPAATDTLIGKATIDILTNKSLSDSTTYFVDALDNTKRLNIDVNGTTGVTGVLQTAFTTAKTISFPDTAGTVALTNQNFYIGTQSIGITATSGTITSLPGVTSVNGATIPSSGILAINPTTAKGDLIYASVTGTPATLSALAVPSTDGYLLTYNSTSGLPEWRAAATTGFGYVGGYQTTSSAGSSVALTGINSVTSTSTLGLATPVISTTGTATSSAITIAPGSATTSSLTLSATGGNVTITSGAATLSNASNGTGAATSGNVIIDAGVASAFVQSVGGTVSLGTTNAGAVNIGTSGTTLTINNSTITGTNATALNMNGASPSIVTTSTGTASVFNTNALTLNLGNAATTASLANASTTLSIGNTATTAQTVNMFTAATAGGTYNIATSSASSGTKAINIGTNGTTGSTTTIIIGTTAGTTPTIALNGAVTLGTTGLLGPATMAAFNTVSTNLSIGGAATTLNLGASTGTLTIGNATITGTNATALNLNGATTITVAGSTATTGNLLNTTQTTLNIGGAATTLTLGNTATGAQTVSMFTASTGAGTYNFATGANTTASKTITIGNAGSAGTTNINIGTQAAAGTQNIFLNGNVNKKQTANALNTSGTVTAALINGGIVTSTTAAAVTGTLDTGTAMDAAFTSLVVGMSIEWSVVNTGTNNFTVAAAASGHTVVGNMVVYVPSATIVGSGRFLSTRTGTATWVTYRIA